MEASLALTIIGTTLIIVGFIFNAIPVLVNKQIMGELAKEAINPAAALRTVRTNRTKNVGAGAATHNTQSHTRGFGFLATTAEISGKEKKWFRQHPLGRTKP